MIKAINTNRFYLQNTNRRFIHLVTMIDGIHEFILFLDTVSSQCYIEEITGGQLEAIEDDNLWHDLWSFTQELGVTMIHAAAPLKEQPFTINKE